MMTTPCYPNGAQNIPRYGVSEEVISSSLEPNSSNQSTHPTSFLYNLSLLKDKVHQVQSLATIFLSPNHGQPLESTAMAMPTLGTLIQEIIVTASSMMFACQQMSLDSPATNDNNAFELHHDHHRANKVAKTGGLQAQSDRIEESGPSTFYSTHHDTLDHWYGDNYNNYNSTDDNYNNSNGNTQSTTPFVISNSVELCAKELPPKMERAEGSHQVILSPKNYDIIEMEAADLLAKYTHYCQVCGKGFKRDANLRMHMRAHGDEYKSSAALSNPIKNNPNMNPTGENPSAGGCLIKLPRKYSCPQEGCRWNKKHAKFQPLKSMICVKNHYKRSHCPKMYVCKRCNMKHFSVLSDLKTHEKHCGDVKWQCSCGTTFSRKDKLMGHVALFVGHTPAVSSLVKGNGAQIVA
ncbi:hypothetical protein BUALT_Bualt13G0068300 [Buddleja alternifolia]|uniref:C2H2-type domain-containing protein n=1 Tax=Buddleja alternifolia TaxID=168488 RepID=A0AAV6WUF7_9LAMI|nr:hypothetical protein BUALT_Bualt13G0068300 [Buddleja alternifolia]